MDGEAVTVPLMTSSFYDGEPAKEGVAGTTVAGDAALASLKVSFCFLWPLRSGQSLMENSLVNSSKRGKIAYALLVCFDMAHLAAVGALARCCSALAWSTGRTALSSLRLVHALCLFATFTALYVAS